jgi:hypothetical protein
MGLRFEQLKLVILAFFSCVSFENRRKARTMILGMLQPDPLVRAVPMLVSRAQIPKQKKNN